VWDVRRVGNDTVLVSFSKPMKIVSTVPVMSDNGYVENIVFKFVPKTFYVKNLIDYYKSLTRDLGVEDSVVFLTATSIEDFSYIRVNEVDTDVFMTVGLDPATCIEMEVFKPMTVSTINIVVVTRQPLTDNAMVDLLRTAVEAKCLASSDVMLRCRTRSSGTVSDAVAVLKPLDVGEEVLFAGMATTIGNSISKAIYKTIVSKALNDKRMLFNNLTGLNEDELLRTFRELYKLMPIPDVPEEKAVKIVRGIFRKIFNDPNVWSLIIAARELDLHGLAGSIPGITSEEFAKDVTRILADEIVGMALATYIAGIKGLFSTYWVERLKKDGVLKYEALGVFEDDVISALLGSLYVLLYEYVQGDVIDA